MKKILYGVLILLLGYGQAGADAVDERDPVTIIKQASSHILEVLENHRTEFAEHPELMRAIVRQDMLPLIDQEYSARLVLGRAGRGATAEQLSAFSEAVSNALINRYADGLLGFKSDEQLEVLPIRGNNSEKLTRVRTRIRLAKGGYTPIDFSFHKTDQGWKAFDVTVEGISYVITFRNQISPRVKAEGIDKVTADIIAGNVALDE